MSVDIEQCVFLDATPDAVWQKIDDIRTHGVWMRDAVEITQRSASHTGVGAEFDCLTKIGPFRERDVLRVTEWEPGSRMGIEHRGVVKGHARFELAPETTGTRFCWSEHLQFPWWMGGVIGERAAKPVLGRVWRANLARLKTLVES
jgi:hypothetical protein